jgi:hypothetical protein
MKTKFLAMALITGLSIPAMSAWAQTPAAPAPAYSVATTTIGELLDKPALKAIFEKHLPEIVSNPQIDRGRALTLPDIVQYVPEIITPAKLAAIDTELKALPPQ